MALLSRLWLNVATYSDRLPRPRQASQLPAYPRVNGTPRSCCEKEGQAWAGSHIISPALSIRGGKKKATRWKKMRLPVILREERVGTSRKAAMGTMTGTGTPQYRGDFMLYNQAVAILSRWR